MSGKKGMKVGPQTPEQVILRQANSAKGGSNKGDDNGMSAPLVDLSVKQLVTLDDHDKRMGLPITWADSIKRQQVIGEQLANDVARLAIEAKRTEIDKERGRLFTLEQVREREHELNALIFSHLSGVADMAASLVEAHEKEAARKKGREWISKVRNAVADAIGKPSA